MEPKHIISTIKVTSDRSKSTVLSPETNVELRLLEQAQPKNNINLNFYFDCLQSVTLTDNGLKISYLNKDRSLQELILSPKKKSFRTLKQFFTTIIPSYKKNEISNHYLKLFAKSIFQKISEKATILDQSELLRFTKFAIQHVYKNIFQLSIISKRQEMTLISNMSKTYADPKKMVVSFQYQSSTPKNTVPAAFIMTQNHFDYHDFKHFFTTCFSEVNFSKLTFGYVDDLCKRLYNQAMAATPMNKLPRTENSFTIK